MDILGLSIDEGMREIIDKNMIMALNIIFVL